MLVWIHNIHPIFLKSLAEELILKVNYQSHPSNCFLYLFPGISNSWEHGREYDVYSKIATFLPIYKQLYTYVYLFTAWYRAMGMIHAQSK